MIILPEDFENGGEVDCGAHHRDGSRQYDKSFRVSIRKSPVRGFIGAYQVYRHYHASGAQVVEREGTLLECVNFVNREYGYDDKADEQGGRREYPENQRPKERRRSGHGGQ